MEARATDAIISEILSSTSLENGLVQVEFLAKTDYGEEFMVDTANSHVAGLSFDLDVGDVVMLQIVDSGQESIAYLEDVHREPGVLLVILIFAIIAVAVGRSRGLLSLVGLALTVAILFGGLLPAIVAGHDPLLATVGASVIILGVNMHLSHGFKRRTFFAYLGTVLGMGLVVLFTKVFVSMASLTGLASEEAALLFWETGGIQLPVGILSAGIILGAVGVLDDIAITQSEIVSELQLADPTRSRKDLFSQAMGLGRHHIASVVNTLVLVYAGAALPAFLLFFLTDLSAAAFLNNELVAEEIIRTLAGTSALVLTVPIITWIATLSPVAIDTDPHAH